MDGQGLSVGESKGHALCFWLLTAVESGKVPGASALPTSFPTNTHPGENRVCLLPHQVSGSGESFHCGVWGLWQERVTRQGGPQLSALRGGQAQGVWEKSYPGRDVSSLHPAQEGGRFISPQGSPQEILVPGALQHSSC